LLTTPVKAQVTETRNPAQAFDLMLNIFVKIMELGRTSTFDQHG